MNSKKFEYIGRNLTKFTAKRCDFIGGIDVVTKPEATQQAIAEDFFEMAGYHAVIIRPELNSFAGYDAIEFLIDS